MKLRVRVRATPQLARVRVKFDHFLVGCGSVAVDVAVDKMIGQKYTRIAHAFVKSERLAHLGARAFADGPGVQVGFV